MKRNAIILALSALVVVFMILFKSDYIGGYEFAVALMALSAGVLAWALEYQPPSNRDDDWWNDDDDLFV